MKLSLLKKYDYISIEDISYHSGECRRITYKIIEKSKTSVYALSEYAKDFTIDLEEFNEYDLTRGNCEFASKKEISGWKKEIKSTIKRQEEDVSHFRYFLNK